MYSNYQLSYEQMVISNYKSTIQPFVTDDLAFDLLRLLDLSVDINTNSADINIYLTGSVSKQFDFAQALTDYNSFLNNSYFSSLQGVQSANFNSSDNTIDLVFGSDYEFNYNFDTNIMSFTSSEDSLLYVDLNLDYEGADLNSIVAPSASGSSVISISYIDDTNSFTVSYDFTPTTAYRLILVYNNDYNIEVGFGNVGSTNSIKIDSNSPKELNYSVRLNYAFDSIALPIYFDTILHYNTNKVDSNAFLKIRN